MTTPTGQPVPSLVPDTPPRMLGEAIRHLRSLPLDPGARADAFDALARQIEANSGGSWQAARGTGTDGATIFLERQGEGLVVATDGRIYRGALGRGLDIDPTGVRPDYAALVPLD